MPDPSKTAKELARRNAKINKVDAAKKKKKAKKGSAAGRKKADPGGTLKRRTKSALRSRVARAGGANRLTPADRRLAKREGLKIEDLF